MQLTVEKIRTLKGAPLSILMALALTRQPVTGEWLQAVTGYSDKSVSSGLKALQEFGYITRNGRYAWQLAGDVKQLPLTLEFPEGGATIPTGHKPGNCPNVGHGNFPSQDIVDVDNLSDVEETVDNSVDKIAENVDKSAESDPGASTGGCPNAGVGEIPSHSDALASLESLTSFKKPKKEKILARGEPDPEIFRILDENAIREPARSQIANQPDVSARLIAYHCKTAPNTSMAIYRIKKNWRVPKHWQMPVDVDLGPVEPDQPAEIFDPLPENLPWEDTLGVLANECSKADYQTWVAAMKPLGLQGDVLVIRVANEFAKTWLEKHVKKRVEQLLNFVVSIEI